jgi:hypothetical protein
MKYWETKRENNAVSPTSTSSSMRARVERGSIHKPILLLAAFGLLEKKLVLLSKNTRL